jgi:cytochrome bd-type quinol oxidase subunit 2
MTLAEVLLGVMFVGLIAYALFGGADFGAGIWDLFAGGTRRGARQRELIEHSIAPVWEANHVWLIFVLVVLWTAFSGGFAAVVTTLYIPLIMAAFGMLARGAAFAYRKSVATLGMRRFFGGAFALSSFVTPFFLGAVVGGVASSRVPPGIAQGNVITSWVNPTSILGGVLAIVVCAYLAAVRGTRTSPTSSGRGRSGRRWSPVRSGSAGSSCSGPTPRCSTTVWSGAPCRWCCCRSSPGSPRSCCSSSGGTRSRGSPRARPWQLS